MIPGSEGEILADLADVLGDFHGREYSAAITPGTMFFADLGLASIDAVVLGEAMQDRYGRPMPFGELMAELGRRADRDVSVGEIAKFLHENR